jgi:ABC-2 type transport system permease protein
MTLKTFFTIVLTDLKLFFADRRAVMLTLLVPIGIASFFGLIFGSQGSGKAGKSDIAIADSDQSPVTKKIITKLKADGAFNVSELTEAQARKRVKKGDFPVAAIFPAGFAARTREGVFGGGKKPALTIVYDPSKSADRQMLKGLLIQQTASIVMQNAMTGGVESSSGESGSGGGFTLPFQIVDEASTSSKAAERRASATHVFVGMGVQGLLFFTIDFAIGLLREKKAGMLRRIRTAPVARTAFLASRLVAAILISLLCLAGVLGFGAVLFGFRITGSVPGFLLMALATSAMTASFGLAVAALGKTEQQARAASVPCVLAMSILGGAWFPSFFFPAWLQTVSKVFPTRWAVEGFDNVTWRGLGLSSVGAPAGIVLGFAAVLAGFALWRFKWE